MSDFRPIGHSDSSFHRVFGRILEAQSVRTRWRSCIDPCPRGFPAMETPVIDNPG